MYQVKCKHCGGWKVRREKLRCKNCLYEFSSKKRVWGITKYQRKKLLKWFLRCQSVNVVVGETGISKYRVLKALSLIRETILPSMFGGIIIASYHLIIRLKDC